MLPITGAVLTTAGVELFFLQPARFNSAIEIVAKNSNLNIFFILLCTKLKFVYYHNSIIRLIQRDTKLNQQKITLELNIN